MPCSPRSAGSPSPRSDWRTERRPHLPGHHRRVVRHAGLPDHVARLVYPQRKPRCLTITSSGAGSSCPSTTDGRPVSSFQVPLQSEVQLLRTAVHVSRLASVRPRNEGTLAPDLPCFARRGQRPSPARLQTTGLSAVPFVRFRAWFRYRGSRSLISRGLRSAVMAAGSWGVTCGRRVIQVRAFCCA